MISSQLRKNLLCCLFHESNVSFSAASLRFFSTSCRTPENPQNSEAIELFLKENCFSDQQLQKVLKARQQLVWANLEKTLQPKLDVFHEFGFSKSEIAEIIAKEPSILCSSTRVIPSLCMLQDLFGSHEEIVRVLRKTGWFLITDLKKTLYPNIEFLKSRGVSMESVIRLLGLSPTLMFFKNEVLRKHVERLEELGTDSTSKMFIYALWTSGALSKEVLELKFQTLRGFGLTEAETLDIFRRTPVVFTVSPEKMMGIVEAILATKKYTVSSIRQNAMLLCCSLEKRIKPRLRVLEVLEKRKLIKEWPNLGAVYLYTDNRFYDRFIAPYAKELEHVCPRVVSAGTVRGKNPFRSA